MAGALSGCTLIDQTTFNPEAGKRPVIAPAAVAATPPPEQGPPPLLSIRLPRSGTALSDVGAGNMLGVGPVAVGTQGAGPGGTVPAGPGPFGVGPSFGIGPSGAAAAGGVGGDNAADVRQGVVTAVAAALRRKPDVVFDVVESTGSGPIGDVGAEAADIARLIVGQGVPASRVRLMARPGADSGRTVRVYVH